MDVTPRTTAPVAAPPSSRYGRRLFGETTVALEQFHRHMAKRGLGDPNVALFDHARAAVGEYVRGVGC